MVLFHEALNNTRNIHKNTMAFEIYHLVTPKFNEAPVVYNYTGVGTSGQDSNPSAPPMEDVNNISSGYIPGEDIMSPGANVALIVIYSLTTLLAVCGNAAVILVFMVGKRCRSDLRGFLVNLACSDLIMAIFCMPFTFTMTMMKTWIFSRPMCPIVLYLQTVSVTSSVCTNMAIGIDRLWVVLFPLKSRITKSRSKWVIAVIWIISLALSSVQLAVGRSVPKEGIPGQVMWDCVEIWPEPSDVWRRAYTFFILSTTYIVPLLILTVTYGFVGCKLWQRTAPGNADEARDTHQLRSKRKVIKMLVVVVVLFGICWLPLHVFFLILDFQPQLMMASPSSERLFVILYYCVHWLAMSNSFVNPIIYGFLNDSFRGDLKRLIRLWCPCCRDLACLNQDLLTRESTYRAYSTRCPRDSTSGSLVYSNGARRKLLSVKVNGCGKYETELSARDSLLKHDGHSQKEPVDLHL